MRSSLEQNEEPKIDITFIIEPFWDMSFRDNIFEIVKRLIDTVQQNTLLNYELLAITSTYEWEEEDNDKLKELLVIKSESKVDYQHIPFEVLTCNFFDITQYKNDFSKCYNILCKQAKGNYICIVNPYDYLPHNFSLHLLNKYVSIQHSGIVGLCDLSIHYNNTSFSALSDNTNENFELVLQPKDYIVNGTVFFSKDMFHTVGAFDEERFLGHSCIIQYCLRAKYMGFHNYYLPDLTKTTITDETFQPCFNTELGINDMISNRNFHIPILY
jgi:hypothetical protein